MSRDKGHKKDKAKEKSKGKSVRKGQAESPLGDSPSHLLHRALQLGLDIYAEETGPGGLTQRQFAVLTAVAGDEGLTQTDLVKATGIDRSTLADMVARMISKGLVERERSTSDARANAVRLTEQGRAELDAVRPKVDAADRRILALLPRGKRDGFLGVLRAFARAGEAVGETAAKPDRKDKAEKAAKSEKPDRKKKRKKAAKAETPEPAEA